MADNTLLLTLPRTDDTEVRVTLKTYRGKTQVDVRLYWMNDDGNWCPTKKGAAVRVDEFARADHRAANLAGQLRSAGMKSTICSYLCTLSAAGRLPALCATTPPVSPCSGWQAAAAYLTLPGLAEHLRLAERLSRMRPALPLMPELLACSIRTRHSNLVAIGSGLWPALTLGDKLAAVRAAESPLPNTVMTPAMAARLRETGSDE